MRCSRCPPSGPLSLPAPGAPRRLGRCWRSRSSRSPRPSSSRRSSASRSCQPQHRRVFPALKALSTAAGAGALTASLFLAPVVAAGAWANFLQATGRFSYHDMLSGQAANLWWIVTYVMRAIYDVTVKQVSRRPSCRPSSGHWASPPFVELGYPNPRLGCVADGPVHGRVGPLGRPPGAGPAPALPHRRLGVLRVFHPVRAGPESFSEPAPCAGRRGPPGLARAALAAERNIRMNLNLFYGFGDGRLRLPDRHGHRRHRVLSMPISRCSRVRASCGHPP